MQELNLDTMAVDADVLPQEAIDAGAPPEVHVQVVSGNDLPFADPRNPNRPMRYPALAVNFQLSRSAALEFAELLKSKAESLPDDTASSKLAVVKDMSEVDNVVQLDRTLRGKPGK
jgi:hypothetical protein